MEYKIHLGYKVYENGNVENNKGVILKPLVNNGYSYYEIKNKKISAGQIVLLAFGILPKKFNQKVKRKDGNPLNNALNNLLW